MDPNAALLRLRSMVKQILAAAPDCDEAAENVADAFNDLDEWLTKGGFLPDAWKNRQSA